MTAITPTKKAELMAELRAKNIATLTMHFDGGNDEGGINSHYVRLVGDEQDLDYQAGSALFPMDWEKYQEFEASFLDRWGSFAGDFSVNGTIVWDVEKNQVRMEYSEETMQPVDSGTEVL